MNKKGILWLTIFGFVLFAAIAPFLLFPCIENKLNDEASLLDSVKSLEMTDLSWQGRNGYLDVPANIDKNKADKAAEEIEQIPGVRNVRVIYNESKQIVIEDESTDIEYETDVAPKSLGKFKLEWNTDDKTIDGRLDEQTTEKLLDIFGVEGLEIDSEFYLTDSVLDALKSIGDTIFIDITEGMIIVDGETISIFGTASEDVDFDELLNRLGNINGIEIDIKAPAIIDDAEKIQSEINEILENSKIEFDYAKSDITETSEEVIDKIAQILLDNDDIYIDIVGHTDTRGSLWSNMALSILRAEAVFDRLVEKGIDPSRMTADGMGETMLIDDGDTQEAHQRNRRVEIIVKGDE